MAVLKSILPVLEARSSDPFCRQNLVPVLSSMASFHLDQESHAAADLKAALDYATRAVKAAEKEFGADAEDLLEPLRLVLRSRMALKMDSLDVLERRLSLSLRHLGEGKINTIFARVELGAHLCFLGRFDSAVEALERASSDLGNLPRSALESNREAVEDARGVIEKQLPLARSKQQRQQPAPSASPSSSSIPPPAVPPLSGGGPTEALKAKRQLCECNATFLPGSSAAVCQGASIVVLPPPKKGPVAMGAPAPGFMSHQGGVGTVAQGAAAAMSSGAQSGPTGDESGPRISNPRQDIAGLEARLGEMTDAEVKLRFLRRELAIAEGANAGRPDHQSGAVMWLLMKLYCCLPRSDPDVLQLLGRWAVGYNESNGRAGHPFDWAMNRLINGEPCSCAACTFVSVSSFA